MTEIEKGLKALFQSLENQEDRLNAMYREDLGEIAFLYGKTGDPEKNFKGGFGLAHILAKRNWEGENIEALKGQKGIEVLQKMVEVLAKGEISKTIPAKKTVHISLEEYEAVISQEYNQELLNWLLTAYKKL